MPSIQINDVSKAYGKKRLFQEVTVELNEGKRYGLTGPNGAGKSTFLKIVLTIDFSSIVRRATIKQRKKTVELSIWLKADAEPTQTAVERDGSTVLEIRLPKTPPG